MTLLLKTFFAQRSCTALTLTVLCAATASSAQVSQAEYDDLYNVFQQCDAGYHRLEADFQSLDASYASLHEDYQNLENDFFTLRDAFEQGRQNANRSSGREDDLSRRVSQMQDEARNLWDTIDQRDSRIRELRGQIEDKDAEIARLKNVIANSGGSDGSFRNSSN